jgi:hypothetical protein
LDNFAQKRPDRFRILKSLLIPHNGSELKNSMTEIKVLVFN